MAFVTDYTSKTSGACDSIIANSAESTRIQNDARTNPVGNAKTLCQRNSIVEKLIDPPKNRPLILEFNRRKKLYLQN